ncbi:MAG TPA: prolipoprotein diacylglyceryl transferase family protein [Pirellula sp.]|nr:prolipoprotein diacylglyceryl transferase family protein [Pirellula sp.]
MRQTLFYLPHEFLGIPVLGIGWVLGAIVLISIAIVATSRKKQSIAKVLEEQGAVWAVAAFIVVFLLPQIETRINDGTPTPWIVGLPVRGYGVMLMLGVVSAMAIALHQCEKAGLTRDAFFSLATWTVIAGLLGARVFYVVQKWSELGNTVGEKLWKSLQVTEGGLVVYGSVIGGLIAMAIWTRKNRFSFFSVADCVTPAFFIGLAFGRIGCLLNGCCYGGLCEGSLPSITFPAGSPAYVDQIESGSLFGFETDSKPSVEEPQIIRKVRPNSWASSNNIRIGQKLISIDASANRLSPNDPLAAPEFESVIRVDNHHFQLAARDVPTRSLPVHPSQIYAAVSGLILCAWTFIFAAIAKRTGVVVGVGLIAYGILRIIEEIIRVDEAGQFGTSFSIAQWISTGGILLGICLVIDAKRQSPSLPADPCE